MNYRIKEDIALLSQVCGVSQDDLAMRIGVDSKTLSLTKNNVTHLDYKNLNKLYNYILDSGLYLLDIKEQYYDSTLKEDEILLFHASKKGINGNLSPYVSKKDNDFGQGFYCSNSFGQPLSLIASFEHPAGYFVKFKKSGLKYLKFDVDTKWMIAIAYFRGKIDEYKNHPIVKRIIDDIKNVDYVIAPIADNRMFMIIDSFISGEITDEQCSHCLAATYLGIQYVLLNEKAINNAEILEKCFICDKEKEYYKKAKENNTAQSVELVKQARIKYRGVGHYIDEILK